MGRSTSPHADTYLASALAAIATTDRPYSKRACSASFCECGQSRPAYDEPRATFLLLEILIVMMVAMAIMVIMFVMLMMATILCPINLNRFVPERAG